MSFSFRQLIKQIYKAIAEASKNTKLLFFFITTRNNSANKDVTQPIQGITSRVFKISLIYKDGYRSSFNPRDYYSFNIFYILREEVLVDRDNPDIDYISRTSYATPITARIIVNILGYIYIAVKLS